MFVCMGNMLRPRTFANNYRLGRPEASDYVGEFSKFEGNIVTSNGPQGTYVGGGGILIICTNLILGLQNHKWGARRYGSK